MKNQNILLVHNYYQIPGGEDTVVKNEKEMLEKQIRTISSGHSKTADEKDLIEKIKTVYEGLKNDSLSIQARNELLKSVVEKIVYNKKEQTVDVYFYTSTNL